VILSGKKFEMVFSYTPDSVETHESYWSFEITEHGIQQLFLLLGQVIEPKTFISVGKVNFGPLLINNKNKEIVALKNLEDVPVAFNFTRDSVRGELEYADSLSVSPMSGVVNPQKEAAIEIIFTPKVEQAYNYNINCYIQRKSRPLTLNVKGIGYILHHGVYLNGNSTRLQPNAVSELPFGDCYINEQRAQTIQIENTGEFNFDFSFRKPAGVSFVQVVPEMGTVRQKEKFSIEVRFTPMAECRLSS